MLAVLVLVLNAADVDGGVTAVDVVDASVVDAGVANEALHELPPDAPMFVAGAVLDAGIDEATPAPSLSRTDPHPAFIKGELSVYLGSDRLVVKNTRIGVSVGLDRFEQAYYALVEPLADLRFLDGKLGIGLGAPLRFEIFNFANDPTTMMPIGFRNASRLRSQDWDSFHDFGRILKYVTFGRKEDNVFISAGQRYSSSIGHGTLVRRYAPNIDTNYPRASAQVDMYNDYAGFEFMTNDLLEWNQLALIGFIKPFSFFKPQNLMLKTLSIGVSGALDWKAPWELKFDDATKQRVLDADGRLAATNRLATLVGADIEVKVVKTDNVDLKPYVDVSGLIGGDIGATLGLLARFNVGQKTVHAFRVVAEARYLGNHYAPSYFDTFYEIDRFAYVSNNNFTGGLVPKQRFILETGLGNRAGYYLEASWGIPETVGLTLAMEGVSNSAKKNFVAHLEVPVLSFVQVFGSYYLRGLESFDELGQTSAGGTLGLVGSKAVAFAGARLQILPFLFVNGRLYKTFRMDQVLRSYDNQFGFVVDVEVGYEFKKSDKPEKKDEPEKK